MCLALITHLQKTSMCYIQLSCLPCSAWMRETIFVRSVMIVLLHGKQWSSHFAVSIAAFSLLLSVATQGSHREKGLSQIAVHHRLFFCTPWVPYVLGCRVSLNAMCAQSEWLKRGGNVTPSINENVHAILMEIRKKTSTILAHIPWLAHRNLRKFRLIFGPARLFDFLGALPCFTFNRCITATENLDAIRCNKIFWTWYAPQIWCPWTKLLPIRLSPTRHFCWQGDYMTFRMLYGRY